MSAGGKKGGEKSGGSDECKAGSTEVAKIRKEKKAALGEFGASMTQRFGRRAPPGEQATKEGAAEEGAAVPLPTSVGERPTEEGAPAQLEEDIGMDVGQGKQEVLNSPYHKYGKRPEVAHDVCLYDWRSMIGMIGVTTTQNNKP